MKALVKATSLLTSVSVVELLMRFVRTKCIALFLGTAGTGLLAQLNLFFETIRMLGGLGTRRAVIKQISEIPGNKFESPRYREVLTTAFALVAFSSCLIAFFVVLGARFISQQLYHDPVHYPYVIFVALMLPVASLMMLLAAILKGQLAYASFAKYTMAANFLVILVTPAAVYFYRYWGALFVQLLFFTFPLIGYLIFHSRKPFLFFSRRIDAKALREQFEDGFNALYQDMISSLARLAVATMITTRAGLSEMGLYQVVLTFTGIYLVIPMQSITGYTYPVIAASRTDEELGQTVNDSLRFILFILMPPIILLVVWPGSVITLFFSSAFLGAALLLKVQLIGSFFQLIYNSIGSSLVAKGKLKALYAISTVHHPVFFGLSVLFFEKWHLLGVAAAFSVTCLITLIFQYFLVRKYFGFRFNSANRKFLFLTAGWLLLAVWACITTDAPGIRWGVLAAGVPWFLMSATGKEKSYLRDKIQNLGRRSS